MVEEQWSQEAASGFDEAAPVLWHVALLLRSASVHDIQGIHRQQRPKASLDGMGCSSKKAAPCFYCCRLCCGCIAW